MKKDNPKFKKGDRCVFVDKVGDKLSVLEDLKCNCKSFIHRNIL